MTGTKARHAPRNDSTRSGMTPHARLEIVSRTSRAPRHRLGLGLGPGVPFGAEVVLVAEQPVQALLGADRVVLDRVEQLPEVVQRPRVFRAVLTVHQVDAQELPERLLRLLLRQVVIPQAV